MRKRIFLWLPPVLYMAAIFHFSAEANPLPELTTHVWDKALHSIEYGGLAVLLCRALFGEGLGWMKSILLAALFASIYGGTDEFHQLFVPGRDSNVLDWTADTIGSVLGALAYAAAGILTTVGRRQAGDTNSQAPGQRVPAPQRIPNP